MQINVKCDDLIHNAQKINVKGSKFLMEFTWWCAVNRLILTIMLVTIDGTTTLDHRCAGGNWNCV